MMELILLLSQIYVGVLGIVWGFLAEMTFDENTDKVSIFIYQILLRVLPTFCSFVLISSSLIQITKIF